MASCASVRVCAIDDQPYFRSFLEGMLSEEGYGVTTAANPAQAFAALERDGPCDVVLLDLVTPDDEGVDWVQRLRERWPEQDVVVVSGVGDVRAVVSAMQRGAADYLLKPIDRTALLRSIERLRELRQSRAEHARLLDENLEFMGRISILERSIELLGREAHEIEPAILELMCAQARCSQALLWTTGGREGFRLAAVRGELEDSGTAPQRPPLDEPFGPRILAGRSVVRKAEDGRGSEHLYVPCLHKGELVAVARLSRGQAGELTERDGVACTKIGELAALALHLHKPSAFVSSSTFRDPLTGLPGREHYDEVLGVEVHKAHRFGRRLSVICADLGEPDGDDSLNAEPVVAAIMRTLRGTDVAASENGRRFWVLVTDTDPLGGVVLKRRLAQRIRETLKGASGVTGVAMGVASYPTDGERPQQLIEIALGQVNEERASLAHLLGIGPDTPLSDIGQRLLEEADWQSSDFVGEAAELLIGELVCRPRDRGLLFLAPGCESKSLMEPLTVLGDAETSTEVFVATDGETIPSGAAITALGLPPNVPTEHTWLVRFGEGPPYAMVSGTPRRDGARPVFHSSDPVLVEHMTFRLRAEIGFGVRA